MIDEKEIMPLNYFKYGGVYSGGHLGMRYLIKRTGEKPDYRLTAMVWKGPMASDSVSSDMITEAEFDFTEEGRGSAIEWLLHMYDEKRSVWDSAPSILEAHIDIEHMYSKTP